MMKDKRSKLEVLTTKLMAKKISGNLNFADEFDLRLDIEEEKNRLNELDKIKKAKNAKIQRDYQAKRMRSKQYRKRLSDAKKESRKVQRAKKIAKESFENFMIWMANSEIKEK